MKIEPIFERMRIFLTIPQARSVKIEVCNLIETVRGLQSYQEGQNPDKNLGITSVLSPCFAGHLRVCDTRQGHPWQPGRLQSTAPQDVCAALQDLPPAAQVYQHNRTQGAHQFLQ